MKYNLTLFQDSVYKKLSIHVNPYIVSIIKQMKFKLIGLIESNSIFNQIHITFLRRYFHLKP